MYNKIIERATRHGWKVAGVVFLGNQVYTSLNRGSFRIAIHPTTLRVFSYGK